MATLKAEALASLPGLGWCQAPGSSYLESDQVPTCKYSTGRKISIPPGRIGVESLDPCSPSEGKRGRTKMGLYWNLLQ